MQQYLIFRLYGPLSSWGTPAVGGERATEMMPTRSALLGLLGAALGIRRHEEQALERLQRSVSFGIKQAAAGVILRDYHTAQVPPQRNKVRHLTRKSELSADQLEAVLSQRDYRCDGVWTVALWLREESHYRLQQLQEALSKPVFTLYLGRKSCPLAAPLAPILLDSTSLKEALDQEFAPLTRSSQEDRWLLMPDKWSRYAWEETPERFGGDLQSLRTSMPWDEPLSRERWQFSQRIRYQLALQEE